MCQRNPCGRGATCIDKWSTYLCICPNGLLAENCDDALKPASFGGDSSVEFVVTEQHRRRQLLPQLYARHASWMDETNEIDSRFKRQTVKAPPKSLSLRFRTLENEGVLLYAATNNDYTLINIRDKHLEYSTKLGANEPVNISMKASEVTSGEWHNLTLFSSNGFLSVLLDGNRIGDQLDLIYVHDFLDAYLTSITIGAAPNFAERLPGNYCS